jgi:hypothetical protein
VSPEEKISRLVEEVRAELARLDTVAVKVRDFGQTLVPEPEDITLHAVAAVLHEYYTACETILARIVRATGPMPTGGAWHQTLLAAATTPLENARPAILGIETAAALFKLLNFRHFFRVSFGIDYDAGKLREHAEAVATIHGAFCADIEKFLAALESAT